MSPAGGVPTGWETILRSRSPWGPYERKVVLAQGDTDINGPHQGGWVDTPDGGEDWFIHFQDVGPIGRIVHLNPVHWIEDWPVMGVDKDGDGCGDPVRTYKKPNVGKTYPKATPQESDELTISTSAFSGSGTAIPSRGGATTMRPRVYFRSIPCL